MFKIIKKGSNNFWHVFNNGAKNVSISDFEVVLDDVLNTFVIVLRNGANIPQIALSVLDIIVIDETGSSVEETFLTASQLRARLVVLGYTAYLGAGNADSITGLISEGTNVTITGTGTLADPYVISSSGGSGTTPTLQEVLIEGNEYISSDLLNKVVFDEGGLFYYIRQTTSDSWSKTSEYTQGGLGFNLHDEFGTGVKVEFNPFAGFRIFNDTNIIEITPTSATKNGVEFATIDDIPTTATLQEVTTEGNITKEGIVLTDNTESGFTKIYNEIATSLSILWNNGFKQHFLNDYATADRYVNWQDKDYDGVADIADIPTTATDLDALSRNGSNANSDVDLGTTYAIKAGGVTIQNNGTDKSMKLLATNMTNERTSEWQDKDYTGIADITDIPDVSNLVVKNTAITGATKTKITYDSKGLVTSGADATTDDIADSTNKRYQTDNQNSFNDATSSIQTQLNSKQPALSFTPFKFIQTSQTAHTGTTAETIVATSTINGGTFNSSDVMKAIFKCTKGVTTSTVTIRLKINTTNSLSGATQIAILSVTTALQFAKLKRDYDLFGGTLYGFNFTSSVSSDDITSGTIGQSISYNTANTLYFFWTVQLGTSGDSVIPNLANLTN
ncbi:hypothetical protein UFOVP584_13 [uncultured Caudovirales phage]|uniref:Uncharacterized protein n=1 Tax=uncultured Caudovirales phage TaxID=2100421 RepID=A0A6J5LTF2_9CAUD|nr:hypothetical protein UFOVP304_48 [uncultured Caudovirales phage]CAB4151372.1 hypothetical protein UFOVP584_13 [uncultured Caudovirales phage]